MTEETTEATQPGGLAGPKKSNRGRKKGIHSERIMIYVTPEMDAQIDAVCNAIKMSKTEFIVNILEKHMCEYEEIIASYLEQQKKIQNIFKR